MSIAVAIPVWVWAVLAMLVALGLHHSRTRRVAPAGVAAVAVAMSGLSIHGVIAAFGLHALPLACWKIGLSAALAAGHRLFGPHGLERERDAVRVPGSWLPMVLMLGIFGVKFVLGFASGAGLPVVRETAFVAGDSLLFGFLGGSFTARALAILRFSRSAAVPAYA